MFGFLHELQTAGLKSTKLSPICSAVTSLRLNNSIVQQPSSECNSLSASKEIPNRLWNLKTQNHVHKNLPLVHTLFSWLHFLGTLNCHPPSQSQLKVLRHLVHLEVLYNTSPNKQHQYKDLSSYCKGEHEQESRNSINLYIQENLLVFVGG